MPTPAEMRDRYRAIAHRYRSLPGEYGLRPYSLAVVIVSHTGTYPGDGTESASSTAITERDGYPPKIRALKDEELALAGLSRETYEVGPITPDFSAGGTSLATLLGTAATNGKQVQYILTGPKYPDGVRCERVSVVDDRALHYKIRIQPINAREV